MYEKTHLSMGHGEHPKLCFLWLPNMYFQFYFAYLCIVPLDWHIKKYRVFFILLVPGDSGPIEHHNHILLKHAFGLKPSINQRVG
jgi:hypothetical protein